MKTSERFWHKVNKTESCWLWFGAKNTQGYGHIRVDGRDYIAHRFAWILTHGTIPNGLCVLHNCDTPLCCNPAHLHLGTAADNRRECIERGRMRVGMGPPDYVQGDELEFIRIGRRLGITQAKLAAILNRGLMTIVKHSKVAP